MSGTPEAALAKWFPAVPSFRGQQRAVIDRLIAGRSTLLLMPTGGGKSLTYQLPALAAGKVALVVSPLVALMRQHAETLGGMGANVLSLGGIEPKEAQERLRSFSWKDGPGFIFVSPERTETDGYLEYLLRQHKARIGLVAIDEAHCISQWGHDFRPPYKALPGFLDRAFGRGTWPPILCLTATLDAGSQSEVISDFRIGEEDVLRSTEMLRTNLHLKFETYSDTKAKLVALQGLLEERRGEKLIVYAHLKQNKMGGTRALTERFSQLGHRCEAFDADMELEVKDRVLSLFVAGELDVVFATGAFGMGIDIPDIRGVVHFLLPESIEQYYQEVGRAGRDGKPAFGLLLYTPKNAKVREDMIRGGRRDADEVRALWEDVIASARVDLRSLSPSSEFGDRKEDYAVFYAFQRLGAVQVIARGPGRIGAFEAGGAEGAAFLQRLSGAVRTDRFATAVRKLMLDPGTAYDTLFDLYTRGEIKLVRSPDNVLLFHTRDLTEAEVQMIADEIDAKIERRLAAFEEFRALVASGADPAEALQGRFG